MDDDDDADEGAQCAKAEHGDAPVAVENAGPNQRPVVIATTNATYAKEPSAALAPYPSIAADAEPVAGAFGEGHAQYEQADQQSASFRPGVPRVMLFGVLGLRLRCPQGESRELATEHRFRIRVATVSRCQIGSTCSAFMATPPRAPMTVPMLNAAWKFWP